MFVAGPFAGGPTRPAGDKVIAIGPFNRSWYSWPTAFTTTASSATCRLWQQTLHGDERDFSLWGERTRTWIRAFKLPIGTPAEAVPRLFPFKRCLLPS